jgi:hypothetical protein
VLLQGEPEEIDLIADPLDDLNDWYVKEYGGGVMIREPKVFGRLFVQAPVSDYDDLQFVSRSC